VIETLNHAVNAVLADPKLQARLAELGGEPMPMTPTEFGRLVMVETEKWASAMRAANIKAD
jgi:tripartite-type tricarboxylate transporter receptor subunit TctC